MKRRIESVWDLGVPLYVPGDHPRLMEVIAGSQGSKIRSVIICLEDAIRPEKSLECELALLKAIDRHFNEKSPLIFCRPRNLDQLKRLVHSPVAKNLAGYVIPKINPESWRLANDISEKHGGWLMPVLETALVYRFSLLEKMLDALVDNSNRLLAARMGGNDLAGLLGTRRGSGKTIYAGPIGPNLTIASNLLISNGIPVAGVVYEQIEDMEGLFIEAKEDVDRGLIPKAAIHPKQIDIIIKAYQVNKNLTDQAESILKAEAPAVYRSHGSMIEPSTHKSWANTVVIRQRIFGN